MTLISVNAQKSNHYYAIGFYNLENLFDTIHDQGKNDKEFLPEGKNNWTKQKYEHKISNLSKVITEMGTDMLKEGCAVIGVAEVENSLVLDDLTAKAALNGRRFNYVHVEGPDQRGIDCALLYNPELFTVKNTKLVPFVYEKQEDSKKATRGFLTVSGELSSEHVTFVVCHLPSRYSAAYYRQLGGKQLKALKDSLQRDDPKVKIFIMGDMNDDPFDISISECLSARRNIQETELFGLYNPFWNILVSGSGTLTYRGSWNLFDQIIVSENMLNKKQKKKFSHLTFYKSEIFRRDYLIQQTGKYKGSPFRTFGSGQWLDGYSDHLPVVVYLIKG